MIQSDDGRKFWVKLIERRSLDFVGDKDWLPELTNYLQKHNEELENLQGVELQDFHNGLNFSEVRGSRSCFFVLHRENGPAVIFPDESRAWFNEDRLHRTNGPAVVRSDGSKEWWVNGRLHREGRPAIQRGNGSKEWWVNGFLHRENGPAKEYAEGSKEWWLEGRLHREDGPAILWCNGVRGWYIQGVEVNEKIVMEPQSIGFDDIQACENSEVRSIMIDRYGWLRYLGDSRAIIVDQRHNDIENTKEILFKTDKNGLRLVVTCPTGRVFVLRVPKNVKTCVDAQKWLGNDRKGKFNVIGRT